jgi:hypothetical protein
VKAQRRSGTETPKKTVERYAALSDMTKIGVLILLWIGGFAFELYLLFSGFLSMSEKRQHQPPIHRSTAQMGPPGYKNKQRPRRLGWRDLKKEIGFLPLHLHHRLIEIQMDSCFSSPLPIHNSTEGYVSLLDNPISPNNAQLATKRRY